MPCTNWFSQDHLAPIGPLVEQGQWANRSTRLSQGLQAVRKSEEAWPGSNNTPLYWDLRGKSVEDHQKFFWNDQHSYACKWALRSHTNKVSIFHWGATLSFLWCTAWRPFQTNNEDCHCLQSIMGIEKISSCARSLWSKTLYFQKTLEPYKTRNIYTKNTFTWIFKLFLLLCQFYIYNLRFDFPILYFTSCHYLLYLDMLAWQLNIHKTQKCLMFLLDFNSTLKRWINKIECMFYWGVKASLFLCGPVFFEIMIF